MQSISEYEEHRPDFSRASRSEPAPSPLRPFEYGPVGHLPVLRLPDKEDVRLLASRLGHWVCPQTGNGNTGL